SPLTRHEDGSPTPGARIPNACPVRIRHGVDPLRRVGRLLLSWPAHLQFDSLQLDHLHALAGQDAQGDQDDHLRGMSILIPSPQPVASWTDNRPVPRLSIPRGLVGAPRNCEGWYGQPPPPTVRMSMAV